MKVESAKKDQFKVDTTLMESGKYVVTKDNRFRVDFGLLEKNNRWIVVKPETDGCDKHWVEFRVWTFAEEIELRKKAMTFDPVRRLHLIDQDVLNQLKVKKLLMDWSLGQENEKLKLFHVGGVLVDESWNAFSSLFPNIIRFILDSMNAVLECGE